MLAQVGKRVYQAALVMLVVAVIAFGSFRFLGDPVGNMVGPEVTPEEKAQIAAELGLADPLPVQFLRFLGNVLRGDLGRSYQLRQPVGELIVERAPATLELALAAAFLSMIVGLPLGIYTAVRSRSAVAKFAMAASLLGVSIPSFLLGILLIMLFSVDLGWLPSFGRGDVVQVGWWSTGLLTLGGLKALILPSVTLAAFQTTMMVRLVNAEMLEVMRTDYIRFARARGIRARTLYFRHAMRNTMIPVLTVTGLQVGHLIAFSVITETVFQWPGLGLLFIQAVNFADVPVIAAYLLFVALVFVSVNLAIDMLYLLVDPRLRVARR
ncbi:MAG TPA: ABC transporter permease [Reyranella sp.]|nr:ABC transporter permease [Reyranella sp.]